ncbi:uncharacterized protein BJX67DRAFT_226752 [Aspergillus lucknowensis]|uniref:Uncharacterized protein n=1 Tax=Aspergillus lucknowensis TaxID=176173 RepID=A0ABR4LHZ0_9EURO
MRFAPAAENAMFKTQEVLNGKQRHPFLHASSQFPTSQTHRVSIPAIETSEGLKPLRVRSPWRRHEKSETRVDSRIALKSIALNCKSGVLVPSFLRVSPGDPCHQNPRNPGSPAWNTQENQSPERKVAGPWSRLDLLGGARHPRRSLEYVRRLGLRLRACQPLQVGMRRELNRSISHLLNQGLMRSGSLCHQALSNLSG